MSESPAEIGRCPRCENRINEHAVLIEYQQNDQTKRYAECPACGEVVRPEGSTHADV